MANVTQSQARLTNALLAGNLYTNHKINKNLTTISKNQQQMAAAITSGFGKIGDKIDESNQLLRSGNRLAEQQLKVQSKIASQQELEYLEKQQNKLVKDTFFNISEEYEKLCKNRSEDLLNKYFKLTSLQACLKKNQIDSSIASSMEDKKFISNVLENIESDISSSQNAFNDQQKKDFEEVLDILETDEEAEIRETNKEIKTKKNSIREDEKIISDHEKTINNFKTWVNECVENPLFSLVILFKEDQKYFNDDIKIRKKIFEREAKKNDKTFFNGDLTLEAREELKKEEEKIKEHKKEYMDERMCDSLILKYANDCKYAREKITWFNDLEYARGNIFYPACFYYKTLERYKHLLNKKNEGVEFISSIIEKNASKLGVDYFLKVRADLIYRLINEQKYKSLNEDKKFIKSKTEKKLSEIIVEEDMINDHKSSLQPLIKIITKALELLEEKLFGVIKDANERISIEKSNIQELENKNNEAQKVISQEQKQANALYKKYPFIKEILTNRI
tara:strand:- start:54 stop:1574 length:1521 start_codon:yes stop_codon:yes gene_type:complete